MFNGSGLDVYDISVPSTPQMISVDAGVDSIMIRDNFLFTTIGEIGLIAFDISDINEPTKISTTPFPLGMPWGASLDGDWIVGGSNIPYSIALFYAADPYNPIATDTFEFEDMIRSVTVKGDYVYVAHGVPESGVDIFLIDPEGLLVFKTNISGVENHRVIVESDRAYIVSGGGDVTIFDVTDPTHPVHLGVLRTRGMSEDAKVLDGYIYVADGYFGLTVIKLDTD